MSLTLLPKGEIQIIKNIDKIQKTFDEGDYITKAFLRNMILSDTTYLQTSSEIRKEILPLSFVPVYMTQGLFGHRLHTPHTLSDINNFNKGAFINIGTPLFILVDAAVRLEILSPFYSDYISKKDIIPFLKDRNYPYIDENLNMKNAISWLSRPDQIATLIKLINNKLHENGFIYTF
jgi:hypothetical protein